MNDIPVMTHPLGEHWRQPKLSELKVYSNQVRMTESSFNKLKHYQFSTPTGAYTGKMWKYYYMVGTSIRWILCWFDIHPKLPNHFKVYTRNIIIENE